MASSLIRWHRSVAAKSLRLKMLVMGALVCMSLSIAGTATLSVASAQTPKPFTAATSCPGSFFGLKAWWAYLPAQDFEGCEVKCFNVLPLSTGPNECQQTASDIPFVLLAVVDDLLRVAGLVAVGFIIYAAFGFVTSQGNPEDAAKARGTAINALIGLVIAMVAVVLVSFIAKTLGG